MLLAKPSSFDFGTVARGKSKSKLVTLKNTGSVALAIADLSTLGREFSQSSTCGATLGPGDTCTVTATFKPTRSGLRSGGIVIIDDTLVTPQKIVLTGTGG